MLLRSLVIAPGNHSRARFAAAWPRDLAPRWHLFADAQWRLPVAHERSCAHAARDSPPLPARCRGLRRILEDDDPDVPLREAAALDDPARSHDAASARSQTASFPDAALPFALLGRTLHAGSIDDHECRRFSRPVVRDRRT